MYNLRFILDENGEVERCCFKKIPTKNEIDVLTYQDIIWDKKKLKMLVNYLIDNSINHKVLASDPNTHDFKVSADDIKSMLKESSEYKHRMAIRKANAISKGKFTQTEKKTPKKKEKLQRKNKFVGTVIVISVSTLVALGAALAISSHAKKNNTQNETQIEQELTLPEVGVDGIVYVGNDEVENVEETQVVPTTQEEVIVDENDYCDETFSFYTTDNTSEKKFIDCKNAYYDIIKKYADIYGIDVNLALAVACQERGTHSNVVDAGGGLGLFQIQVEGNGFKWEGKEIEAFNFDTNSREKMLITKDIVSNLEENVKAGIMMLQDCLSRRNYNLALGVQEYNTGYPGIQNALRYASEDLNKPMNYFNNIYNLEWTNYREKIGYGDPHYLEHVFRYVDDEKVLTFKVPYQGEISIKFDNLSYDKNIIKK